MAVYDQSHGNSPAIMWDHPAELIFPLLHRLLLRLVLDLTIPFGYKAELT